MSKAAKGAGKKGAAGRNQTVVVSCVNLKGGVGKTAIAVNFAAYCGSKGLRTLLIDLDPQTNSTFSCMSPEKWEKHAKTKGTVADLLGVRQHTSAEGKAKTVESVIIKDVFPSVDLIPSHLDLFTIDLDLSSQVSRETRLRRAIRDVLDDYDIVVCDCPPNLTIPTQNALAASTHYLVPVSLDFLSSIGIALLLGRIKKLSDDLEIPLTNAGIVISRVGRKSYFRSQTAQSLKATFKGMVLSAQISERSAVAESAAKNISVFSTADHAAIDEFTALGDELLDKLGIKI
ncbi:MAG: ParA family protein [Alphaproteobacteria bacterium]|nr:ParA family protein [Alphaproteobacteria bacterium]